jgi:hypothetical protein
LIVPKNSIENQEEPISQTTPPILTAEQELELLRLKFKTADPEQNSTNTIQFEKDSLEIIPNEGIIVNRTPEEKPLTWESYLKKYDSYKDLGAKPVNYPPEFNLLPGGARACIEYAALNYCFQPSPNKFTLSVMPFTNEYIKAMPEIWNVSYALDLCYRGLNHVDSIDRVQSHSLLVHCGIRRPHADKILPANICYIQTIAMDGSSIDIDILGEPDMVEWMEDVFRFIINDNLEFVGQGVEQDKRANTLYYNHFRYLYYNNKRRVGFPQKHRTRISAIITHFISQIVDLDRNVWDTDTREIDYERIIEDNLKDVVDWAVDLYWTEPTSFTLNFAEIEWDKMYAGFDYINKTGLNQIGNQKTVNSNWSNWAAKLSTQPQWRSTELKALGLNSSNITTFLKHGYLTQPKPRGPYFLAPAHAH